MEMDKDCRQTKLEHYHLRKRISELEAECRRLELRLVEGHEAGEVLHAKYRELDREMYQRTYGAAPRIPLRIRQREDYE